jgi:hypothetical protein
MSAIRCTMAQAVVRVQADLGNVENRRTVLASAFDVPERHGRGGWHCSFIDETVPERHRLEAIQ